MKICYHCELCGTDIDAIDVAYVDEAKLGFDCLTAQERRAIIDVDAPANTMHVKSLCDTCAAQLGFGDEPQPAAGTYTVH